MKFLWILNTAVGILAFLLSFFLEYFLIESITGQSTFAFFLTLVLECGKIFTVVFHRLIEDRKDYEIPDNVVVLNTIFKFGLVFLSLICSVALISNGLDRPNLDTVKSNDKSIVTNSFSERIALIDSQRQKLLDKITNEIKEKYQSQYQELDDQYLPKIQQKEKLRDAEFSNVIGGVRKGPYWYEYDRQLNVLKNEYKTQKDTLRFNENTELERNITKIETEIQKRIDDSLNQKENSLSQINKGDYKNDERAKNEVVASFLATIHNGLGFGIQYLSFALFFSVLTSTLLELTIYITFNYVTMFYNNFLSPAGKEFAAISQTNHSYESGNNNSGVYEEPINNGNYQQDMDSGMNEYFQNLQSQFQTTGIPRNDFVAPCAQEDVIYEK